MAQVTRSEKEPNHLRGNGDPNLRVDAPELFAAEIGATYARSDGGAGTALYVCVKRGIPATGGSVAVAGTWTAIA
jgi:hypothetical protein